MIAALLVSCAFGHNKGLSHACSFYLCCASPHFLNIAFVVPSKPNLVRSLKHCQSLRPRYEACCVGVECVVLRDHLPFCYCHSLGPRIAIQERAPRLYRLRG
ncbi:hypothetical protein BDV40DRAFT_86531 [Aspergillus tamarii]|uniref:Uncharacterized protein n=1 Tax=Aspergillus tamarii TaxID=41984 RepID=A0A5N6V230_ASPTM|nr:hypothetical protein BDV40DRAFT_86531 [Aspergillus tamarii]